MNYESPVVMMDALIRKQILPYVTKELSHQMEFYMNGGLIGKLHPVIQLQAGKDT